jgi:hypothetical protein
MEDMFKILLNNPAVWKAKRAGYTCGIYFPDNGRLDSQIFRARLLAPTRRPIQSPTAPLETFDGKYLTVPKAVNQVWDCPTLPVDPSSPLFIVEGAFNAARLRQDGFDAIAISGVENWRLGSKRSTPIIPELIERVKQAADASRSIIIMFDSDGMSNPNIAVACHGLCNELSTKVITANIYTCFPPRGDDGQKQGPDDFLHRRGRAIFEAHLGAESKSWEDSPYIRKMIDYQRYVMNETTGKAFDTDAYVFGEVTWDTADKTLMANSFMINPFNPKGELVQIGHKHYLNSKYALRAKGIEWNPAVKDLLYKCPERNIMLLNTFPHHLIPEPVKGDIDWWHEMTANLGRDTPVGMSKAIKIAAAKVQNPLKHYPKAIALIGDGGAGKSLFAMAIGLCVGDFSDAEYDGRRIDNDNWAGHLVREWGEKTKGMDVETFKRILREETTFVRPLYDKGRTIPARTLHICTSNLLQQLVDRTDRVLVFCGEGRKIPESTGAYWKKMIGSSGAPGPGIAALRYHLLYEVNADDVDTMDNSSELRERVVHASQEREDDVIDEVIDLMSEVPGLEILTSDMVSALLAQVGYKGSFMSLRKKSRRFVTPAQAEGVKIEGKKFRFVALKNVDYWKAEADNSKYVEQAKLALALLKQNPSLVDVLNRKEKY